MYSMQEERLGAVVLGLEWVFNNGLIKEDFVGEPINVKFLYHTGQGKRCC